MSETAKDFADRVASSVEPMDFNSSQAKRVIVSELERRDTAAERRGFIKGLEAARRYAKGVQDVDTVKLLTERIKREKEN